MRIFYKILLCLSVVFTGCEKKEELFVDSDKMLGYWTNPTLEDTLWIYERVNSFPEDKYGFAMKQDQIFVENKNSGWCGTPPVDYGKFKGKWIRSDSTLSITVGYWGGTAQYKWRVISVENKTMTIYKEKEEYFLENGI